MAITKISPSVVDFDDGITISTTDNSDNLTIISTDADANVGPAINLYRNSGTPADNDFLGNIKFNGRNDNTQDVQYAEVEAYILDASDGVEDGLYNINVMTAGTNRTYMQISGNSGVVFNEDSNDIDFRVESNDSANMLVVDGGDNKVLIEGQNTASVTDSSSMQAAGVLEVNGNAGEGSDHIKMGAMADGTGNQFIEATNSGATAAYDLLLQPINGGTVGIGTTNATDTLHISRTSTSQTAGLTLENLQSGGYGSGITWESIRSDSGSLQTAGRISVQGENAWSSDATASSAFYIQLRSDNSLVTRFTVTNDGVISSPGTYAHGTSNTPNMYVHTNGVFYRSTSSRRYKNTIEDAKHGLSDLLKLRSVTYKGNDDAAGDKVFGGFIAEEVHDAGLTEFVEYNDDNEPDALAYGNMVSLCVKAIQEQQALIETLQAEVKALKGE